jgi:hypothetical protein
MKTYKVVKLFSLSLFAAALLSFNCKAGGDVYEIFLNNKLVCKQQFGKFLCGEKGLQFSQSNINHNLVIRYSHCGRDGAGRKVIVKDESGHTVKEWKFADNASVTIPVKEILDLEKGKPGKALKLYYFSAQYLPEGRMLTSIKMSGKTLAANPTTKLYWFSCITMAAIGFPFLKI